MKKYEVLVEKKGKVYFAGLFAEEYAAKKKANLIICELVLKSKYRFNNDFDDEGIQEVVGFNYRTDKPEITIKVVEKEFYSTIEIAELL